MKLNDLQNGQIVRCRTGRAGRHAVQWGDWRQAELYVQRHPKTGNVLIVTPKDEVWAEAGPNDLCEDGILLVEDYYLQIEGLEK